MVDAQSEQQVTFFELLTAMAFSAFADTPIEVGVIEVGMGGTWDATNVIDSLVQVVTPISLDHRELGDTIAEVATEKSGILRAGGTAILASQTKEAASVLLKKAAELEMTVAREGLEFGVAERTLALGGQLLSLRGLGGEYGDLFLPMHGAHQAHNAAAALAAVEAFLGAGADGPLDIDTVRVGFAAMDSPGRLETIRSSPTIILDGAHNAAGAKALATALAEDFSFDQLVGVVAILSDKDVGAILSALEPVLSSIVVTQNSSPRAMTIDELANEAVEIFGGDRVDVEPRLDDAIDAAVRMAEDDTPLGGSGVIVTGSLVTVGEARRLLTHGGR
jgi:dihydrofolate synthase/folylpolyglutamate synthase